MKFEFVIQLWHVLVATVGITSAFAVNTYMTRQNANSIKNVKDVEIKTLVTSISDLEKKCNLMMKESEARKTFVTREIFYAEIKHLNKDVSEVKDTVNKIWEAVQK